MAEDAEKPRWAHYRKGALDLLIELFIVFVGVTAAFALDGWRSDRADRKYHHEMIASLGTLIDQITIHNLQIERAITAKITAFDAARARGERPPPPIYRETAAERAPVGAWTGLVTTGAGRSLPPQLYFRLSEFFNNVDAWGDKYARYNNETETRVMPNLDDPAAFYTPDGKLRGEFRVYVDRLRDIATLCRHTADQATSVRRAVREASR